MQALNFIGGYMNVDTDTSNAVAAFDGNGSTHVAVSMNGTTTGGLLGTKLRFTCLSATRWMVEGIVRGSGTVSNSFATSGSLLLSLWGGDKV